MNTASNKHNASASKSKKTYKKSREKKSVIDFIKWVEERKGGVILYRGQQCSNWSITTSASRLLKMKSDSDVDNNTTKEDDELIIREISHNIDKINDYQVQDLHQNKNSEIAKTNLGILAQLQHDGGATSLIDFSGSPLNALWFACQKWPDHEKLKARKEGKGGKVFAIYAYQPSEFEKIDSVDKLNRKIENIIGGDISIYWKPAHINSRIIAQNSFFVMGGQVIVASEFFIHEEDKKNILEILHRNYNIKEASLFPDSSGFAKANSIKKEYSGTIFDLWEEGLKLHSIGLHKQEIKVYEKIINGAEYSKIKKGTAHHLKGYALSKLGELEEAISHYNKAIEINPEDYSVYINLGFVKLIQEEYDAAITLYNHVIDNLDFKSWQGYNDRGFAKYLKGIRDCSIRQMNEAIKDCNKALEINPYSSVVYSNRGKAKSYKKWYEDAIKDFNKSIKRNPYRAEVYGYLGIAHYNWGIEDNNWGMLYESIDDFNKSIEVNPKLYEFYFHRGEAFKEVKMYDEAIKDYECACLNNINNWDGNYKIATIRYKLALINESKLDMGKYGDSLILLDQAELTIKGLNHSTNEPINKRKIRKLGGDIIKLRKKISNKKIN